MNLRTPRHGSEGPSTSHHITSRTTHRRDGASQPLEPLATPRNLLATCLATSQPPETSRNPFRTPLAAPRAQRPKGHEYHITSHRIIPHHTTTRVPTKHGRGVASSHRAQQWRSLPLARGPTPLIETQQSSNIKQPTRGHVEPSNAATWPSDGHTHNITSHHTTTPARTDDP